MKGIQMLASGAAAANAGQIAGDAQKHVNGGIAKVRVDPQILWSRVRKRLWSNVGEDVYNSWFTRIELEEICDDIAHLSVPTRFLCSWILFNYQDLILDAFIRETDQISRLQVTVRVNGTDVRVRPRRP